MSNSSTAVALDRDVFRARLEAAWRRSDEILGLVADDAMLKRPIRLRQPFIFYVGHLPAFAWNQVMGGLLEAHSPAPELDSLFARGIDPVGIDEFDGGESWPAMATTIAYRDRVRAALLDSFEAVEERAGSDPLADRGRVYSLVLEHELMHHETLLYMIHQLDRELVRRPAGLAAPVTGDGAMPGRVAIRGGPVTLGADFDAVPFGWDNEFPRHEESVAEFQIDRTAVRNSEWLAFLDDGGYARRALWSPGGWEWRERVRHDHPVFWKRSKDSWLQLTVFDELPLSDVGGWPVYVSHAEAEAYANWAGGSLPTEAQFHAAADSAGMQWGEAPAGNFDFANWAPTPVGHYGGAGPLDLVGNGWEWTRTRFAPFDGFRAWARTYPGYSADFFDEQHFVMLGASWATDRALVRRSFRNWFQPQYPYVFAKFRLVRDQDPGSTNG